MSDRSALWMALVAFLVGMSGVGIALHFTQNYGLAGFLTLGVTAATMLLWAVWRE
jgi:hypothetical protein